MSILVGIAGHPPEDLLAGLREDPDVEVRDLDVPDSSVPIQGSDPFLPRVFCSVLRTIVANACAWRPAKIVADMGEGKCDGMRYVATLLKDLGIPVVRADNLSTQSQGTPISMSGWPLRKKVESITARLLTGLRESPPPAPARYGFWGVPPTDMTVLDLFPPETHVFGWTRCMENGTPADLDLELFVDTGLPTVFFAQAFCAKNALARSLAQKHNGLHVEATEKITRADRAKIEAFLEFNRS